MFFQNLLAAVLWKLRAGSEQVLEGHQSRVHDAVKTIHEHQGKPINYQKQEDVVVLEKKDKVGIAVLQETKQSKQ